jgi:hypothetical protein
MDADLKPLQSQALSVGLSVPGSAPLNVYHRFAAGRAAPAAQFSSIPAW